MDNAVYKYVLHNAFKYNGKANLGAIIGKLINEDPSLKDDMKSLSKEVAEVIKKVNSMSLAKQIEELRKIAPEMLEEKKIIEERKLPQLQNIQNSVVLRIAPYPSGPLHIGNAKQMIINDEYAKIYNGKLLLILDDTIGSEEKSIEPEAYDLIPESLRWLNINFDKNIIYKSDRLPIYYKYAEELIKNNAAYICFCNFKILRENRKSGKECSCRSADVKNNLYNWDKMLKNDYIEGEVVLRLKTSMNHPNPAFRDRVLFRISNREHPRVGNKYKVWPTLEMTWSVDDYLLKITHVIRGKELMIESDMELFIWEILKWKGPELIHTGLLNIEGVKISKSKSRREVKEGKYFGWDDPRTWSLQSLKRRGFKPEAIRKFCLSFGINANEVTVSLDNFYAENRKLIGDSSNRYFLVEDPIEISIDNFRGAGIELKLHPDFPERGFRKYKVSNDFYISNLDFNNLEDGKVHRLMDCCNFVKNRNRFEFHSLEYEKFKNSKNKGSIIHYVPKINGVVSFDIIMDDGTTKYGFGEPLISTLSVDDIIQAERRFFCRLDKIDEKNYKFWFTHK